MNATNVSSRSRRTGLILGIIVAASMAAVLLFFAGRLLLAWVSPTAPATGHGHAHHEPHGHAHEEDSGHGGHGHQHPGHDDAAAIDLSESAQRNIGLQMVEVELGAFTRAITIPAMVVERPGRSQIHVTSPMAGVVTRIDLVEGMAIEPEHDVMSVRLTHEDLVATQRDFLKTAENLDVVLREIDRLKSIEEGVVPGRRILEQEYERKKLEGILRADRQALMLHGLGEEQVESILRDRELLSSLTVRAPAEPADHDDCTADHLFHVQQLLVKVGEHVEAGQLLCVLADHCALFVEGRAFEDDAFALRAAAREEQPITAGVLIGRRETDVVEGLKLLYLADRVDPETRALRFYLSLPNEVVLDRTAPGGRRFITWRFNPGQRMELRLPVERWEDRIVLPIEAIVDEGAETYVYQHNVDHFDRVPVHVEYRDQRSVVISSDGAISVGDVVAARGAYQIHLALKNKSGGGVDPHAGHSH